MKYLPSILAIIAFLLIWQGLVMVLQVEAWLLPAPSQIMATLFRQRDLLFYHTTQTVIEVLWGLCLGTVVGVILAVAMEWSLLFRKIFRPFILMSQSIPFITLAPLLIIWLGFGLMPKIVLIALAYFLPVTINLYDGFAAVNVQQIKLLRAMHASKWQIFRLVKIPSALPYFFSGFRLAGAYVIGVAVVSEWIGADRGLGIFLVRAAKSYLTDSVFAIIFVVTFLSVALVFAIDKLTQVVIPWHFLQKGEGV